MEIGGGPRISVTVTACPWGLWGDTGISPVFHSGVTFADGICSPGEALQGTWEGATLNGNAPSARGHILEEEKEEEEGEEPLRG